MIENEVNIPFPMIRNKTVQHVNNHPKIVSVNTVLFKMVGDHPVLQNERMRMRMSWRSMN